MGSNLIRWVIAVAIGGILAFALLYLAQYAGNSVSPDVYDIDSGEVLIPLGSTIALIVGWFVGSFAGSWFAMRISGKVGAGWIVAGTVIGAALYRAWTLGDAWWILALGLAVPLAAALLAQRAAGFAAPATA